MLQDQSQNCSRWGAKSYHTKHTAISKFNFLPKNVTLEPKQTHPHINSPVICKDITYAELPQMILYIQYFYPNVLHISLSTLKVTFMYSTWWHRLKLQYKKITSWKLPHNQTTLHKLQQMMKFTLTLTTEYYIHFHGCRICISYMLLWSNLSSVFAFCSSCVQ